MRGAKMLVAQFRIAQPVKCSAEVFVDPRMFLELRLQFLADGSRPLGVLKTEQGFVKIDCRLGRCFRPPCVLCAGDRELALRLPLVDRQREMIGAPGAVVDDAFSTKRNDGNVENGKPQPRIVARQVPLKSAALTHSACPLEVVLSVVVCSDSVDRGGHVRVIFSAGKQRAPILVQS